MGDRERNLTTYNELRRCAANVARIRRRASAEEIRQLAEAVDVLLERSMLLLEPSLFPVKRDRREEPDEPPMAEVAS